MVRYVVPSHPVLDTRHPKHLPHRPAYTTIIEGKEFCMSDEIRTIIAALYGEKVAAHAHFSVNGKPVEHRSLIDEHQGQVLHIAYHVPEDKAFTISHEWITSIQIPEGFAL